MNVKRVLSLLLAMAMVFSMMPMSVLAEELGTPAEGTEIVEQVEKKKEESAQEPAAEELVVPANEGEGGENEESQTAEETEGEESQTTEGAELVAEGKTIAEAPAVMMLAASKSDNKDDELVDNGDADDHGNNGNHGQKICGERLTTKDDVQDVVLTESDKNKKVIITGTQKVFCPVHGEYDVTESVYINVKKGDDEESLKKAGEAEIKKMLEGSKCKKGAEPDNDSGSTTNLEDIALKLVVDGETAAETGLAENQFKYGFDIPSLVNPENNEGMVFVSVDADAYYIEKIVLGSKSFTEDDAISGIEFNDDQCDIDVWALCEDEENGINEIKSITAYVKTKQTAEGFAASIINDLPDTVKFFSYENENEEYETGYKTKRNGTAGYTDVNGIDAAVKVDSEIIKDILVQFYEDTEANYTGKKSDWADYIKKAWTSNNENGININEDDLGAFLDIDAESMGKFNEYEWYILKKHCDVNAWHMDGVAKPKFSVTINRGEGVADGENNLGSYISGKTVEFTVEAKDGYVIDEVTADNAEVTDNGDGSYSVTVGEDNIIIKATATKLYKVTASAENGIVTDINGVALSEDVEVKSGETFKFTVTPNEGYEVEKVTVTINGTETELTAENGEYSFEVTGDAKINATFKLKEYTVTTKVDDGAKIVEPIEDTYKHFEKVEFAVELDETYYGLVSVKANDEGLTADENGKYSFTVTDNTEVTVETSEIFYGVTFGGDVNTFAVKGDYTAIKPLTDVTFTVEANQGYRLVKVSVDGNELIADGNGGYTVKMERDKTVIVDTVKVWNVTTKAIGGRIEAPATVDNGATLVFKVAADKHNNLVKVTANGNEVQPSDKVYKVENVTGDVEIIAEFNLTATVYARIGAKPTDEKTSATEMSRPSASYYSGKIGTATISGETFKNVIEYMSIAYDKFDTIVGEPNNTEFVVELNENATNENGYTYYVLKHETDGWHIDAVEMFTVSVDENSFGCNVTAVDGQFTVEAGTVVKFEVTPNGKNVFVDKVTVNESPVAADSDDIYTITVDENKVIKTTAKVKADFYLTKSGEKMEEVTTKNVKDRKNYDAELYSAKGEYGSGYVKGELAKELLKDGYVSIEVDKSPDIECDNEVADLKPWYVVKNISDGRWHVDGAIQKTVTYIVKNNGFEAAPAAPEAEKVGYNQAHTIKKYDSAEKTVDDGTWKFDGWKANDGKFYGEGAIIDVKESVELVGEWKFTANPPAPVNPTPAPGGDDDDDSTGGGSGGGGRVVWENSDNDIVTIDDEEVPLAAAPMMMTILDEEVPLGFLPQTGGSAQFLPATCAVEADLSVREEEEE